MMLHSYTKNFRQLSNHRNKISASQAWAPDVYSVPSDHHWSHIHTSNTNGTQQDKFILHKQLHKETMDLGGSGRYERC